MGEDIANNSNINTLNYVKMLNGVLPDDIRVLSCV